MSYFLILFLLRNNRIHSTPEVRPVFTKEVVAEAKQFVQIIHSDIRLVQIEGVIGSAEDNYKLFPIYTTLNKK